MSNTLSTFLIIAILCTIKCNKDYGNTKTTYLKFIVLHKGEYRINFKSLL